jgi:uncharacterized membrane protein
VKHPSLIASAIAGAIALGAAGAAYAQEVGKPAPVPTYKSEKCYGIAKAGKNDCQTRASSCAGTSKRDGQADAWVYVPEGTCGKIVNAMLSK